MSKECLWEWVERTGNLFTKVEDGWTMCPHFLDGTCEAIHNTDPFSGEHHARIACQNFANTVARMLGTSTEEITGKINPRDLVLDTPNDDSTQTAIAQISFENNGGWFTISDSKQLKKALKDIISWK